MKRYMVVSSKTSGITPPKPLGPTSMRMKPAALPWADAFGAPPPEDWTIAEIAAADLAAGAAGVVRTSAKTGDRVENAFTEVARTAVG